MFEAFLLGIGLLLLTAAAFAIGWRSAQAHALKQDIDFFNGYNFDDMFSDTPIGDRLGRKYDA